MHDWLSIIPILFKTQILQEENSQFGICLSVLIYIQERYNFIMLLCNLLVISQVMKFSKVSFDIYLDSFVKKSDKSIYEF